MLIWRAFGNNNNNNNKERVKRDLEWKRKKREDKIDKYCSSLREKNKSSLNNNLFIELIIEFVYFVIKMLSYTQYEENLLMKTKSVLNCSNLNSQHDKNDFIQWHKSNAILKMVGNSKKFIDPSLTTHLENE